MYLVLDSWRFSHELNRNSPGESWEPKPKEIESEWRACYTCGGDIPPENQWGKRGESREGDCPRAQRSDGMCGAFAPRVRYQKSVARR